MVAIAQTSNNSTNSNNKPPNLGNIMASQTPSTAPGSEVEEAECARFRISIGGRFEQKPDGSYKYVGGQNFLDSIPVTWRYADLMFSLSEKVDGAVSVKYQLPGEQADPDTLITVADDSDLTILFDEYFLHLRKSTTPIKTYRLHVYLFRAAEEEYTPEDLAAEARYGFTTGLPSGASSLVQSLRFTGLETDPDSDAMSGPLSTEDVEETELAWEAGFKAGQEAAVLATEEEWKLILTRRMARLARVASSYMMGEDVGQTSWSDWSAGRTSPGLHQHQSFDSAAMAAATAAAAVEVAGITGARAHSMYETMPIVSSADIPTGPPKTPRDYSPADAPDNDPNFKSMFESKYEVSRPASPETVFNPLETAVGRDTILSPTSMLPTQISIFGDAVTLAEELAAAEAVGATPPVNLPSHISEFGDDEEGLVVGPGTGTTPEYTRRRPPSGVVRPVLVAGPGGIPLPPDALAAAAAPQVGDEISEMLKDVPRIDFQEVTVVAKIGEGAFGEVSLCECPTYGRVAVKWIKPQRAQRHKDNFAHEARVMSKLNHPNVLRFYGLVIENNNVVGIMTEFAAQGSLAALLRSHNGFVPLRQRAHIALQAVSGMAYLHSQKIVHFDVKPDNLLIDGDWNSPTGITVKVADFGLSVVKYNTFCSNVQDLRGTLPYMAPEMVTDHKHVTEAADVFSLGVCFWELLTGQIPYADVAPATLLGALGSGNLRLPIPDWCEPEWRALMEACWLPEPTLRPTCKQLIMQLERMEREAPLA